MNEISSFYYKKPKHPIIIYIIFILISIILIYVSLKYETYDLKELLVLNECDEEKCILKTSLNYEDQNIIDNNTIIKYENKNYHIEEISYDEPYLVDGIPTTDIELKTDLKVDKKILKIEVKYNKQKIIKKIKEKIIERK